jgi:hypothetical protein
MGGWVLTEVQKKEFLSRKRATNRPVGGADSFRLGEMELSADLPFLSKHGVGLLKADGALEFQQVFEVERFDEIHHPANL